MNRPKKRIAWVTPRCFVETDIYTIDILSDTYDIDWHIIDPCENNEYEELINKLRYKGVRITKHLLPARNRSIRTLWFYVKLLFRIRKSDYDLIYNAIFGGPFYSPLEYLLLNRKKTVIAFHNVSIPKGAKNASFISRAYNSFVAHSYLNYQTFSKSQCEILKNIAIGKNVFSIPFFLKDYGISEKQLPNQTTFLFFGQILEYKRPDVLIEAAENVYARTNKSFNVKIYGNCPYWDHYRHLIKHPELFDICIRRIENEEIPDLFSTSHYFVMPYQDIAQSGALIVAINYGLPVILSKLPAFEEYIESGYNGYFIRPANVEDLECIMTKVLLEDKKTYFQLRENMSLTRDTNFSKAAIKDMYISEFNNIISNG